MAIFVTPDQWFKAATSGDIDQLQRWHKAGVLKKQRFEPDQVVFKPGAGRPSLARLLTQTPDGQSADALQMALDSRETRYAIALLEWGGANVEPVPNSTFPSHMELVGKQFLEKNWCTEADIRHLVRLLNHQGLSLNLYNKQPALQHALDHCDALLVKLLLELGADPNLGKQGSPLASFIQTSHLTTRNAIPIVKALLEHGADPNGLCKTSNSTGTPLLFAAVFWDEPHDPYRQLIQILLESGADPDFPVRSDHQTDKHQTAIELISNPELKLAFQKEVSQAQAKHLERTLPGVEENPVKKVRM